LQENEELLDDDDDEDDEDEAKPPKGMSIDHKLLLKNWLLYLSSKTP